VRARPFVSRISEVLPTRSEIEVLRKKAALAEVFTGQIKEAREHLTMLQTYKMKRDEEDAKKLAQEKIDAEFIDPRLRSKTHRELVEMVNKCITCACVLV
jgi:vacuolar-type H+-ATPase subunit D/Vma8